jgi:hypothetical protein
MTVNLLNKLYSEASYWHGTGRYKYSENGEVVDILKGMIQEGGLVPHDDDWDTVIGKVQSISLGRSRMYAKLYALMYLPHNQKIYEYGPRWLWFHYFAGTIRIFARIRYLTPYKILKDYQSKLALWAKKITSDRRKNLYHIFRYGSDIQDNYSILIGIKGAAVKPLNNSPMFSMHEIRSGSPIHFHDMTHIEVPSIRIKEAETLLHDAGIKTPVISIESGERHCRKFSFFTLVSGKPLREKAI